MITATVEGAEEIARALKRLPEAWQARQAMQLFGKHFQAKVAPYPGPREGSTYVRTGNLMKRWFVAPGRTEVSVGNLAGYAPYVHGDEQVWFHKQTGWKKLTETIEKEMPEAIQLICRQIDRIWAGL